MSHNPMMPKMNPALTLTNNGNTIEVVGPIHWNPQNPPIPREIAAVFAVVVSQVKPNGGIAVAIGGSDTYLPNQPDWDADANAIGQTGPFSPGGATAAAWAAVAHDDGGSWSYQWTLPVVLQ
jgi:hypothetical protein